MLRHVSQELNVLGDAIRSARESERRSQVWLAQEIGVHQGTISRWERGEGLPNPTEVTRIEHALRIRPGALVTMYFPRSLDLSFEVGSTQLAQVGRVLREAIDHMAAGRVEVANAAVNYAASLIDQFQQGRLEAAEHAHEHERKHDHGEDRPA